MLWSVLQVSYGDEKFPPQEQGPIVATPTADLLRRAADVAQVVIQEHTDYRQMQQYFMHVSQVQLLTIVIQVMVI